MYVAQELVILLSEHLLSNEGCGGSAEKRPSQKEAARTLCVLTVLVIEMRNNHLQLGLNLPHI
jgi:hypothetical protein